mgnify:CR=1 FL=1
MHRHIVLDEFYTLNGSNYQNGTRGGPPRAQKHGLVQWWTGPKPGPFFNGAIYLKLVWTFFNFFRLKIYIIYYTKI